MIDNLNDYELVYLAQEQNEDAKNLLHQKYQPLIRKLASKYIPLFIEGGDDINDLIQECRLALEKAIHQFKEKENICFYTFAKLCIENEMIDYIRKQKREKNKALNEAISIDYLIEEQEDAIVLKFLSDKSSNPEQLIIEEENYHSLYQRILEKLSPLEECVFILKIQDFSYKEIASILDKDTKAIDNTIQRMKAKLINIK